MQNAVRVHPDLVYDVGMHKGEDTAYYLAKGYRVVAVEANPDLVAANERRFSAEIAQGQLVIRAGAIADTGAESIRFFKHPNSVWGTTESDWAARNEVLGESVEIEVPVLNFEEQLLLTGMPAFLKIDIEGADRLCLETLQRFADGPDFVSIESEQDDWRELEEEFRLLQAVGFTRFAVVQQATVPGRTIKTTDLEGRPIAHTFEADASGPFGDDVGPWLTREQAETRYEEVFRQYRRWGAESLAQRTKLSRVIRGRLQKYSGRPLPGWYDTHARRD
jgi:FkbM family methyltransferase